MTEDVKIGGIIPAVGDMKQFKRFLKSRYPVCVMQNLHVSMLDSVFSAGYDAGKGILFHLDLAHGLSGDVYGLEYLCQKYRPAGVITSKASLIPECRRLKTLAIQRVFLIDGAALQKSVEAVRKFMPDFVEIMPAMCMPIFPSLKEKIPVPLIAGGLVPDEEAAKQALILGMAAVTISMEKLAADAAQREETSSPFDTTETSATIIGNS